MRSARNNPPGPVVSAMVKLQAVFAGDFEIDQRGIESADLHHVDDEIRAAQRLAAIAWLPSIFGIGPERVGDLPAEVDADFQPVGVDIHVAERRVLEFGVGENVAGQILGKNDAAGADHCNFDHNNFLLIRR